MDGTENHPISDRAARWALPIALVSMLALAAVAYRPLYGLARGIDGPFVASLDAQSMLGIPVTAVLFVLYASRRPVIVQQLPPDPTVLYRFYGSDDALLYVGITRGMQRRFTEHSHKPWWPEVARAATELYPTRMAAAIAEHAAITSENPRYNVMRLHLLAHLKTAGR